MDRPLRFCMVTTFYPPHNFGGMPEIVKESGGGFYDTEEELLAAFEGLLTEPLYRRVLGLSGYETYQQKWTPEAHLKSYFALIREITSNSNIRSQVSLSIKKVIGLLKIAQFHSGSKGVPTGKIRRQMLV